VDLTLHEGTVPREGFLLVEIDKFQGPLDLLLHLIRTQDIDVFDIPISRITDQFLQAIRGIQARDLDSAGEFLEMAATLIRIKAQMLLPRTGEEEDEDPRAELVRRLLEYEQIREISQRLSAAEADRARQALESFLLAYHPDPPPTVAAPGLSPHGQMRAVDFQVHQGDRIIAGPRTATIDADWDAAGWSSKLDAAVRAASSRFIGPLATPREPWHYTFAPESVASQ